MQIQVLHYQPSQGWSEKPLQHVDSEDTLILIFATPEFFKKPKPIQELKQQFPNSKMIGCSGAGEIFGPHIFDNSLSIAIVKFKKTWVVFEGKIIENAVIAVGFYRNKLEIGHASKGGWGILGIERRITRSKNNFLYELDNKPVLKLYKQYLGERALELPDSGLLFPLSIRKDATDNEQLVRTILGVDEENQALIFAGDVPTGYLAKTHASQF